MRCILAILIVFMHAFTCYSGSWLPPAGYVDVPLYKWMSRITFAFTLEAFVFMSGYLLAFQELTLNRAIDSNFLVKKFRRLILPSVVFSIVYFVIFYEYKGIGSFCYSIINGCGHMWFLPMLFWCFVGGWLLEKVRIKEQWKIVLLVILNLLTIINLPFRLSDACSFMVYFYAGFLSYKYSDKIKNSITQKRLIISFVLFVVLFFLLRILKDTLVISSGHLFFIKLLLLVGDNLCQLLYASAGLLFFYMAICHYTMRHNLRPYIVKFSTCCFGIYIFQQFILKLLYYKTQFPLHVGPYYLPWLSFIITVILSYFLSLIFLKTKAGRFMIG